MVDAIVASDLQRASETALHHRGQLGVGPLVLEPGLRERDAGEWSGLTRAEIDRDWPGYLDPPPADRHAVRQRPRGRRVGQPRAERRRPPSWEPDDVLLERVLGALARIHDLAPDGEVIAVTHGGVVYALEGMLGSPVRAAGQPRRAVDRASAPAARCVASAIGWCSSTPTSSPSPTQI